MRNRDGFSPSSIVHVIVGKLSARSVACVIAWTILISPIFARSSLAEEKAHGPTRALISAVVSWLSTNFDLPENHDYPSIELVSPTTMAAIRYRPLAGGRPQVSPSDNSSLPLSGVSELAAVYNDANRTMYLSEGWTGVTFADLSILVHEMVHHLQNVGQLKYTCPQAREAVAFAAQERWLRLSGRTLESEFGIDKLTLLVRTNCLG
jgi:Domain of unknown function (DUF6647)